MNLVSTARPITTTENLAGVPFGGLPLFFCEDIYEMRVIHTINLSDDNEKILTGLKGIVDKSKELESEIIQQNSTRIRAKENTKTEVDLKKGKRRSILDHREQIEAKRLKAYKEAVGRKENAHKKFTEKVSESKQLEGDIARSTRLLENAAETLNHLDWGSTQENLERRATILKFEEGNVNTSVPVTVTIRSSKNKTIKWQSNDVFIRDTCGELLDFNFGKFNVSVDLEELHESTKISVFCLQVGDIKEQEARLRGQKNPHPHINDTGYACLGGPLNEYLMAKMKITDVASVITGMSEFLSSYNQHDAWTPLRYWVPNKSDCPVCRCCNLLEGVCACIDCSSCRRNFEARNMSRCGSCHTCCMKLHKYIDSEVLGPGLNGTRCFIK